MKKTPKKVLGTLGLLVVAATTVFAAFLPLPSASAADTSVVDTITVRVIGNTPSVNITDPGSDEAIAHAQQSISYNYENVDKVTAVLEYTDRDGNPHRDVLGEYPITEDYGTGVLDLNLSSYDYGDYVLKLIGEGRNGLEYEDAITLYYYPVTTEIEYNEETNDTFAILDYDLTDEDIDTLVLEIYDENGNLMSPLSPIRVKRGTTRVELPLEEYNTPEGKYTIRTTAYDASGTALYRPFDMILNYTIHVPSPDVPNTGAMTFGNLNISKTDYLITGLMVFSIVGVGGIYYITHNNSKRSHKKR